MSPSPLLIELSLDEFIQASDLPSDTLLRMIEAGILDPQGETAVNWRFEAQMVFTARRAVRLHQELEIDWPGIALALDLLQELQQLRDENRCLRQRLARFLDD